MKVYVWIYGCKYECSEYRSLSHTCLLDTYLHCYASARAHAVIVPLCRGGGGPAGRTLLPSGDSASQGRERATSHRVRRGRKWNQVLACLSYQGRQVYVDVVPLVGSSSSNPLWHLSVNINTCWYLDAPKAWHIWQLRSCLYIYAPISPHTCIRITYTCTYTCTLTGAGVVAVLFACGCFHVLCNHTHRYVPTLTYICAYSDYDTMSTENKGNSSLTCGFTPSLFIWWNALHEDTYGFTNAYLPSHPPTTSTHAYMRAYGRTCL